jgi:(1->4)-alpha-D-glucan 1-alpha-D-glucosylmutase
MRDLFASDITRLTAQLADVCENRRRYRDYTRRELSHMLREVIACLSIYRTYVQAEEGRASELDRRYIDEAIDAAKANRPDLDPDLFDLFRRILLLQSRGPAETELVMRFQQSTGPVMAKGVEDTLFYCYNRFVALNEVGSEPNRFSSSIEEFHRSNQEILANHPHTMLATTTHDTKRGEDMRMRLAILSEIPQRWAATARAWSTMNDRHRQQFLPDRNIEYLYYQTLVGTWPIDVDRMQAYSLKAAREAKQHTSWNTPNESYEQCLADFVAGTLGDQEFCASVDELVSELAPVARANSLAQTLLKFTCPGLPDIYQGSELWDFRLVDPDNRGPVDYDRRRQLLTELEVVAPEEMLNYKDGALAKLWVIKQVLSLRRRRPELFAEGNYDPIAAHGGRSDHVVAFIRRESVAVIAPRLTFNLAGDWCGTAVEIPGGQWRNVLTGENLMGGGARISDLLRRFPVALLERVAGATSAGSLT